MNETETTERKPPEFFKSREIAEIMRVSVATVILWAAEGIMPGTYIPRGGSGTWRFEKKAFYNWLDKHTHRAKRRMPF